MNFEDFLELVAKHYQVAKDEAMEELDRNFPEEMFVLELFETGSVTISLGKREFVLAISVEDVTPSSN